MPFVKQGNRPIQTPSSGDEKRDGSRDCSRLEKQLTNPDPVARRWAARDLSGYSEAAPLLLGRLQEEQDRSVREVILTSLTRLGTHEVIVGLAECLRSEDVALRNEAIEAMRLLPDTVAPVMGNLLKDSDPDVRIFAVNVLESLRHLHVELWLREVIQSDSHVNVCAAAVDLLGEVGTVDSLEALKNLTARFPHEPYISFAADLALKRIRSI